jgi:hypothetical protein
MQMLFFKRYWSLFVCLAILGGAVWLQMALWEKNTNQKVDTYYLYLDGKRIAEGQDPYSRILQSNMRDNQKYTTYFPGFIGLSYLTYQGRFREYANWLALWRIPFLISNLGIGILIFWVFYARGTPVAGIFFTLFWFFNRWTLFIVEVSGLDFLPIFLLLLSLLLLPRKRCLALLLFSISLALKQIAIFLIPLFLIEAYQSSEKNWLREMFLTGVLIASIPALTSLPFLVWDARGYVYSIVFSVTRSQFQFVQPANSIDMYLNLDGIAARIPMLLLMLTAFWLMFKNKVSIFLAAMLTMLTFADFNSVFFSQYMPWFIMLLPFSVVDLFQKGNTGSLVRLRI